MHAKPGCRKGVIVIYKEEKVQEGKGVKGNTTQFS